MSKGILLDLHILLALMSSIVLAASVFFIVKYHIPLSTLPWCWWMPLILAIFSDAVYLTSLHKHTYVTRDYRAGFLIVLAVARVVAPSYRINKLHQLSGDRFLSVWNCGLLECSIMMTCDVSGIMMSALALVELSLAYRYERVHAVGSKPAASSILVSPAVQQQTHYIPLEQQHHHQPLFLQQPAVVSYNPYGQTQSLSPSAHYPPVTNPIAYRPPTYAPHN